MAYAHDSVLCLMKGINFTRDYEHVLLFDTKEHQQSFFQNDVPMSDKFTQTNCAYIRTSNLTGMFELRGNIAEFNDYGYGYFDNPYGDATRRFYFFVTDLSYKNENVATLTFEIDIMQSYMFDYELDSCFIERAHQDVSDNVGDNLVSDGLNVCNVVNTDIQSMDLNFGEFWTVVAVSEYPDTLIAVDGDGKPTANWNSDIRYYYGLLPSGLTLIVVNAGYFKQFLDVYDYAGKRDAIFAIYAVPDFLGQVTGYIDNEHNMGIFAPTGDRINPFSRTFSFHIPQGCNGYIPKNKKLLTAPYCQIVLTNSFGESAIFDPEKFAKHPIPSAQFKLFGDIMPSGAVYCCPTEYDNNIQNFDNMHMLKVTNNIQGSWVSDSYLNFTAVQDIKNDNTIFHSVLATATNLMSGNVTGAVTNVASTFANINTSNKIGEITPDTIRGASGSDLTQWANNNIKITFYWRTPDAQNAKVIDDFWTRFGYPQKRIYKPNLFSRKGWNYIKTGSCSLKNISAPSYILEKIANIFNRGVTFWHVPSPSQIGNYELDNGFFGQN